MKALILFGSPKSNGNTYKLTEKFIEGLGETGCDIEFINLLKIKVSPCMGCLSCEKTGKCVINDDMELIYKKIEESSILVLSSPVYFASFPSHMKAVIDRCQVFYGRKYRLKEKSGEKRGYLIFTAGGKSSSVLSSMELTSKYFFLSTDERFVKTIYALNTDNCPIESQEELLKEAYDEGINAGRF